MHRLFYMNSKSDRSFKTKMCSNVLLNVEASTKFSYLRNATSNGLG